MKEETNAGFVPSGEEPLADRFLGAVRIGCAQSRARPDAPHVSLEDPARVHIFFKEPVFRRFS
jgi:hypothetical protein